MSNTSLHYGIMGIVGTRHFRAVNWYISDLKNTSLTINHALQLSQWPKSSLQDYLRYCTDENR